MREIFSTLCELAGLVAITIGLAMVSIPAAWIAAGVGLVVVGWASDR